MPLLYTYHAAQVKPLPKNLFRVSTPLSGPACPVEQVVHAARVNAAAPNPIKGLHTHHRASMPLLNTWSTLRASNPLPAAAGASPSAASASTSRPGSPLFSLSAPAARAAAASEAAQRPTTASLYVKKPPSSGSISSSTPLGAAYSAFHLRACHAAPQRRV